MRALLGLRGLFAEPATGFGASQSCGSTRRRRRRNAPINGPTSCIESSPGIEIALASPRQGM
jgi:hypothetical protein